MTVPSSLVARRALLIAGALIAVAVVTYVDFRLIHVNNSTAAFTYLLLILGLATRGGLQPSVAASLASVFCYNYYFLPPVGTLSIADPQNWLAFFAFVITAITTSHLSAQAKKEAEVASASRREMEKLYEFSRSLMLGDAERTLAGQIVQQISRVFQAPAVSLYELSSDNMCHAGAGEPLAARLPSLELEAMLRIVAKENRAWTMPGGNAVILPVSLGGRASGSLGVAGVELSATVLSALAQLTAIAMERARVQAAINRTELTRQNERLKSTLLDALAHEFKTPLTSIKAAVSGVLSDRIHDPIETELLTIVDEEADRLTALVTDSIKMARIGAGQVDLQRKAYPVEQLIASALSNLHNASDGRAVTVDLAKNLPELDVDPDMSEMALRQLIGNALKYAPAPAAIRVTAEPQGSMAAIHVADEGPGIPYPEQLSVFEKFYRGLAVRQRIPGTGMGLTIARDIIRAHGGDISLISKPGQGSRFSFTLPVVGEQ